MKRDNAEMKGEGTEHIEEKVFIHRPKVVLDREVPLERVEGWKEAKPGKSDTVDAHTRWKNTTGSIQTQDRTLDSPTPWTRATGTRKMPRNTSRTSTLADSHAIYRGIRTQAHTRQSRLFMGEKSLFKQKTNTRPDRRFINKARCTHKAPRDTCQRR